MKGWLRVALLPVLLAGSVLLSGAQTVSSTGAAPSSTVEAAPSDLQLNISTSQAWSDSGLELHPGDVLELTASVSASGRSGTGGQAGSCDAVPPSADSGKNLQLPSAPVGALIAKLHSQGGEPFLVSEKKEVKIEEQGHLFLAINAGTPPVCERSIAVKVHLASATAGQTTAPPKDIKTKLAAAAQTWLAGQFGTGNTAASAAGTNEATAVPSNAGANVNTSAATVSKVLNISAAPLDPKLRDAIDHLPRRVNDQLKNLGDMINFVMIGSQKDVQSALQVANWFVADTSNTGAVTKAILMTYEKKDYLQMPMSQLYLFGRAQDFGYEQAEAYSVVASRHHFRLWKAPFQIDGQDVWVGAGTHDIGFEKDQRNGNVTHKIDPAVDGERDHIAESLEKTGLIKTLSYYLPPDPVQEAKNATGGGYHSDGRLVVMWVKASSTPAVTAGPR
jgi:hypothetical protein